MITGSLNSGNIPGDLRTRLQEMLGRLPQMRNKKGAAQTPPPMNPATNVPQATGGFYQQMDPAARQALLRAMMARSRMGRGAPDAA